MTEPTPTPSTDAQPETTDAASDAFAEASDDGSDRQAGPTRAAGPGPGSESGIDLESSTIRRYLAWGALALCSVLAVVATVQFYGSVTTAIDLWVTERYQPLMQAAFNLVVVLGSLTGISLVLRELS